MYIALHTLQNCKRPATVLLNDYTELDINTIFDDNI